MPLKATKRNSPFTVYYLKENIDFPGLDNYHSKDDSSLYCNNEFKKKELTS